MNYTPENKKELTKRYLKIARKRLRSADASIKVESFEDAISRAYYAILDAVTALLILKDIVPKSHEGAMRLFSLHYIKPGTIPGEYQRLFSTMEKMRLEADYFHEREFTKLEAAEALSTARKFVKMAEGHVKDKSDSE